MKRILIRSGKSPFDVVSPEKVIQHNIIGTNAGNLIFSDAVHKMLYTEGAEITSNRFVVDPSAADRINEEYDVFVVPLANAFRPSFEKHLRTLTELIERLTIPVVVFGVGAQSGLDYNPERLAPLERTVKRFAAAVLDRSPSIGVRGEFTESYLNSLGFTDVDVIGCPSMFLNGTDLWVEKKAERLDRDSKIAINASRSALGAGDIGGIVQTNCERYPNLLYIAQELKDLELLYWGDASEWDGRYSPMPVHRTHPLFQQNRVRLYYDPVTWINTLSDYEFAFGTRIHGNIAALLAGTPSVVLCHDSRTLELCRYFDIPHRRISELDADVDPADLYAEADYDALVKGHRERFDRIVAFMDKHGLDHVFRPGRDSGAAFEARMREIEFPPGVQAWGDDDSELVQRLGRLREDTRELRKQQAVSERRIAELTKQLQALEKRVDKEVKRLRTLERDLRNSPYRRVRRVVGRSVRRIVGSRRS